MEIRWPGYEKFPISNTFVRASGRYIFMDYVGVGIAEFLVASRALVPKREVLF